MNIQYKKNAMMHEEQIKSTLNFAKKISDLLTAAKRALPYNLNVIDELHADENAHSRILCKLLQYQDVNNQYRILNSLIHYIAQSKPAFGNIKIEQPIISQEKERIDLWIRDTNYAIIMENKVHGAKDQNTQLQRYIEKTKSKSSKYDNSNIFIIYLPADNHSPEDYSWGKYCDSKIKMNNYANMSFQYDVIPWLKNEVLPYCTLREEILYTAIRQYVDYLEGLFKQRTSQKHIYHMETKWLKLLFPGKEHFQEQLPEINAFIKNLSEAKSVLENYKRENVDKFLSEFTTLSLKILSEEYGGNWRYKDAISSYNDWYFLYNADWKTGSFVHVEWSNVSIDNLYKESVGVQYFIVLHVEGNWTKNIKYTDNLISNMSDLYNRIGRTTFWKKQFDSHKPMGIMSTQELEDFLRNVYTSNEFKMVVNALDKTNNEYK